MWTHNCQRLFTSWECPHHLLHVVQKFHSKTEMWTKLPFLVSLKGWICAPQRKTRHYHQPSLSLKTVHRNFWNAWHTFLEIGIQFRESNLVLGWRHTCVNAWPSHPLTGTTFWSSVNGRKWGLPGRSRAFRSHIPGVSSSSSLFCLFLSTMWSRRFSITDPHCYRVVLNLEAKQPWTKSSETVRWNKTSLISCLRCLLRCLERLNQGHRLHDVSQERWSLEKG